MEKGEFDLEVERGPEVRPTCGREVLGIKGTRGGRVVLGYKGDWGTHEGLANDAFADGVED